MPMIQFFVPGLPATSGSKRPFIYKSKKDGKQRVAMVPDNKRQKPWMSTVSVAAGEVFNGSVLRGPVALTVQYFFPRPKSHYGNGRNAGIVKDSAPKHHISKPDLSKLTRAIEDALSGIVWKDDSQVISHIESKDYAANGEATGALVTISEDERRG